MRSTTSCSHIGAAAWVTASLWLLPMLAHASEPILPETVAALSPTPPAILTPARMLPSAPHRLVPPVTTPTPDDEAPPSHLRDAQVAAAADGATTLLVLQSGGIEMNGLMPISPLGIVGVTALKLGLASQLERLPEHQRDLGIQSTTAVWGGAAANNVLAWAAVSPPVAIGAGLITAWVLWKRTGDKLDSQRLARLAQQQARQEANMVANMAATMATTATETTRLAQEFGEVSEVPLPGASPGVGQDG